MNYVEACKVYKSSPCYKQRSEAFRRMMHLISECMSSPNHIHQDIRSFFQDFGILYENINLILEHYNGCHDCANIIIEYGQPYISLFLHSWQRSVNLMPHFGDARRKYYITFVQVYRERVILPILVGVRSKSLLLQITTHPLYTRDIWRSVFRLTL